jgi:hypothetical protein
LAVRFEIRLRSLDEYVRKKHGQQRALTPDEFDVIFFWAEIMIATIRNQWPVDTGTSRDRWMSEIDGTPGEMGITVENPMYYAEYVHRRGTPADPPLWETLVPEAFDLIAEPMLASARRAVDNTEREFARRRAAADPSRALSDILLDLFRNPDGFNLFSPPPGA